MSSLDLSALRDQIEHTNSELFQIIECRQSLINDVVSYKEKCNQSLWDIKREKKLFLNLSSKLQDLKVAAQFSLMMESQMAKTYPAWSEGEHLLELTGHIRDFINPVLLFVVNKSEYQNLKLQNEIKSLIEEENE